VTTGSHAYRRDMSLQTKPVRIGAGAWVTSRCIVLGGSHIGRSALVKPGTVVAGEVPENTIWGTPHTATSLGRRFDIGRDH
jgi:putative colanic acid biosynthesis acetyltransferase WcaF